MAPKAAKKEDWEVLDVAADSRLPATHVIVFLLNSCLLAGAPAYLFTSIFDLSPQENIPLYGAVSLIVVAVLMISLQSRSTSIRNRLIKSRGVELESTTALKLKEAGDEKVKSKHKEAMKKRNEINAEALAVSLAHTNSLFLFIVVALSFWVMRASTPPVNYSVSSIVSAAVIWVIKA